MKKIICITGLDGTGKTTLIDFLKPHLSGFYIATIWDVFEKNNALLVKSKTDIDNYLCTLSPDSRLLFITHALKYSMDKAINSDSKGIIINGYFYKYFASELALGANLELTNSLISSFVEPNKIIMLAVNPEIAVTRKKKFSRYECGLHSNPSPEHFMEFQKQSFTYFEKFINENWNIIDATSDLDKIKKEVVKNII